MTKTLEKNIINTVRKAVAESIHDVMTDPDYGLELSDRAKNRLKSIRKAKKRKTLSFEEVRRNISSR